ncbi:Helicase associated domain protein [Glutamicibacter soli]
MMYAAGLTAREIADLCHQSVATVHVHLRVREKYTPGFKATHQAALNERDPDRPSARWRTRLNEVISFQATHDQLPSRDGDEHEKALFRWVAVQRRAYETGRISKTKVELLKDLAGWTVNIHQNELDELWKTNLANLQDFISEFETMPRYKNFTTEHEHTLGVWLHCQHQRRAEQRLIQWRLDALDEAVPGWRSMM